MDLVTLVTGCTLTIDPKIMHALIWRQSGGEPWSFAAPGERQPQIYRTVGDAVRAAHATYPNDVANRVGLTGLSANLRSVTAVMFASCPNITVSARQIAQLAERCETSPRVKGGPISRAIAFYRGSRERPDSAFANAVRTSVANHDAPDFEMPANTGIDAAGIGSAPQTAFHDTATAPPVASDDRERGWSSAIVRTKSRPFDQSPIDCSVRDRPQPTRKGLALQARANVAAYRGGWRHSLRRPTHRLRPE
jgi:hypothetical protein